MYPRKKRLYLKNAIFANFVDFYWIDEMVLRLISCFYASDQCVFFMKRIFYHIICVVPANVIKNWNLWSNFDFLKKNLMDNNFFKCLLSASNSPILCCVLAFCWFVLILKYLREALQLAGFSVALAKNKCIEVLLMSQDFNPFSLVPIHTVIKWKPYMLRCEQVWLVG